MKLPRLKEVRELHGWSQKKLAEESGVSRDSISNYETGQREAWPSTAKKLADALGVTIADLMEEEKLPKAVPTTPMLEWGLTAPDEEFDQRISTANEHEVWELLKLNRLVPQEPGPYRDRILARVSKTVSRLDNLGSHYATGEDATPSERTGQEAG